jgi:anti-sigma regulatory factor (Ser/Thr protein kinase)
VELPEEPASVAAARGWVRDVLGRWRLERLEPCAALLVSELVTNSLLHARTAVVVSVDRLGDVIRFSVRDEACDRVPTLRVLDDEPGGLGLHLVDRLAARWGVEPQRRGKRVWFDLLTG